MKNKFLKIIIFIVIFLGGGYLFALLADKNESTSQVEAGFVAPQINDAAKEIKTQSLQDVSPIQVETSSEIAEIIRLEVPFIVQAPLGNWSDSVFQNACEEASIAMAMAWVKNAKEVIPAEAKEKIDDIVKFENKNFGYNTDTNLLDVQKIFEKHFNYQNVSIKENIFSKDIKNELQKGNIVILPVFGRALKNPNFTPPGPIAHMLVVTGFDPETKEFITNDPGTRSGGNYRYSENILLDAIWHYPSGKDAPPEPLTGSLQKAMLIVEKS